MIVGVEEKHITSNRIRLALDRALMVLGQSGKSGVFAELALRDIDWKRNDDSIILAIDEYLNERFKKGASYLAFRFKEELQKLE